MFPFYRRIYFAASPHSANACGVPELDTQALRPLVQRALTEDLGPGDATSEALLPTDAQAAAIIVAREPLTVAGLDAAELAFRELDNHVKIKKLSNDGHTLSTDMPLLRLQGLAQSLLGAERTALNFLQRLSGIATLTTKYIAAIEGTGAKLLDTRKTTPGWRALEKHAVICGGGVNHRMGLHDMVLIKDNHLASLHDNSYPIVTAIERARTQFPDLKIEIEADTLDLAQQAIEAGADIILLDNMPLKNLRQAVHQNNGRCQLEASGSITLENIRAVAETGVDFISVGALTHSAPAVDIALDWQP